MSSFCGGRVAIIGAGPAGLYCAQRLLKKVNGGVLIDIFERRPHPFGLIRYGVAPDHPEVKVHTPYQDQLIA